MIAFISLPEQTQNTELVNSIIGRYDIGTENVFESFEAIILENDKRNIVDSIKILIVHADKLNKKEIRVIKKFSAAKKIVFIRSMNDAIFDIPNLYKVFSPDLQTPAYRSLLPSVYEHMPLLSVDTSTTHVKKQKNESKEALQIGYLPGGCTDTTLEVIKFFNSQPQYHVNIYVDPSLKSTLRLLTNKNISIHSLAKEIGHLQENDVFLSAGSGINSLLSYKRPVMILGNRGYGGWMNKKNFELHHQNGFAGRIGGENNESIPWKLLLEDIASCMNLYNQTPEIGYEVLKYAKYATMRTLTAKFRSIDGIVKIKISDDYSDIVPVIHKSIKAIRLKSPDQKFALTNSLNKIILIFPLSYSQWLGLINGKNSLGYIQQMAGQSNEDSVNKFLNDLIDNNVISFV